jgi:hypothetical protein
MSKQPWQKDTIVIVAAYSLEFLSELKSQGKRPGAMRVTLNKGTPEEIIYKVAPGVKRKVPVLVATELEKYPYVASVMEVE